MNTKHTTYAVLLALTAAAGLGACSHDKTKDETAMREPATAADTQTAVNSDADNTYTHIAKNSETSPKVLVDDNGSAPDTSTNNALAPAQTSSADQHVAGENARYETASRK